MEDAEKVNTYLERPPIGLYVKKGLVYTPLTTDVLGLCPCNVDTSTLDPKLS